MERTISDADYAELKAGVVHTTEVDITTAELLALFTTPKTLVPAPGAGKVLELVGCALILDYNSAAYATRGDLTLQNSTGADLTNTVLLANLLAKTADYMVQLQPLATADTGIVMSENEPILLTVATGNPVTGDSPLRVKTTYRIHDTGL